jgi:Acyltransferase
LTRLADAGSVSNASQFRLLRERRFLPFFVAQACGAFNDNLFKNVLVILVTYQATRWSTLRPELLANIAAGLFILPFVVLSGLAGQLGERFDKARVLIERVVLRVLTRGMKAIPIASAKDDAAILERAFEITASALRDGELVCIFPEGRLTRDGEIASFRAGLTRIVAETPVPVIPMAITGLWGSMFSRRTPKIWQRLPRKLWHRVTVTVGEPVAPENAEPEALREHVCALYRSSTVE